MKTTIFSTSIFSLICLIPFFTFGQKVTVSGYVNDKMNGVHLENVSIFEKGSVIGTITSKNGFYKLLLPAGTINISAKLTGYQVFEKQMTINNDTVLSIQLLPKIGKKGNSKDENDVQALKNGNEKLKTKLPRF